MDIWYRVHTLSTPCSYYVHHMCILCIHCVHPLPTPYFQFLEKGELLHFQFQKEFLKPFHDLMGAAESNEIRDLIVVCLAHMVRE